MQLDNEDQVDLEDEVDDEEACQNLPHEKWHKNIKIGIYHDSSYRSS